MSKLTFKDAQRLLRQVKAGDWRSNVKREYEWKPQSATVYRLTREGVQLWVANWLSYLKLSDETFGRQFVEIPYHLKIYLWLGGVRRFVRSEIKAFNKQDAEKDYQALSSKF